ncbi:MAG: prolyl oligopeptidase family serine peptidase [Flavobacteriales bacterium]|nr:prolyl oligopeptidase family serine peptidase [Flavobacteriales bacterium]
MKKISLYLLAILLSGPIFCQKSDLILSEIMAGEDFIGHAPTNVHWNHKSDEIYFRWQQQNETVAPYFSFSLKSGEYNQLKAEETQTLEVDGYEKNPDSNGGWLQKGNSIFQITDGKKEEVFRHFGNFKLFKVLNQNSVLISIDKNIFFFSVNPFQLFQITNFVEGSAPYESSDKNYLEQQQFELFEIIQLEHKRDSAQKAFRLAHRKQHLSPFYLNERNIAWTEVNNSLNYCAFRLDEYPNNSLTHIESYLTQSGASRSITARAKVGKDDPIHEFFIWDFKNDTSFAIDFSTLSGIKKRPLFFKDYETDFKEEYESPKNVIVLSHGFNEKGNKLFIEVKSYDNKDRWMAYVDMESYQLVEIEHQHDEAWIGGPGISGWNMVKGNAGWIDDENVYFQSEESGYSHLYTYHLKSKKRKALTEGQWEVYEVRLSNDHSQFYITGNKTHPGNRDFYILPLKSGKLIPVLTADGNHEVYISPDEKSLAVLYSYKNKPWELYHAPLKENAEMTQITSSTTDQFKKYPWRDVEVITFKATDGKDVHARIYRPEKEVKNKAAVIFVHGAGYLQNAHNWWSGYYREYMFNNMLCDMGYTVLDIDYRASKGYGRDWRTAIYRFMGGMDLGDQMDGRQFLIAEEGIDEDRIGMYGGSYGGFITLMALLTEPGKFKCGAALRSVTDWAHYNHEYTSNILNTPETDPNAFRKSSPIYFAENLQDKLVMLHGIEDDNVQYQDVVRLSQRFIELGKTNWDLIGFPIEPHGFKETSSWTEEYRRILELFQSELK